MLHFEHDVDRQSDIVLQSICSVASVNSLSYSKAALTHHSLPKDHVVDLTNGVDWVQHQHQNSHVINLLPRRSQTRHTNTFQSI
jgi:hypothetical protein